MTSRPVPAQAGTDRPHPERLHPDRLRSVYGAFPTGVTVLSALCNGVPVGMSVSSFASVSLEPALVSVCVAKSSSTWPALRAAGRVGVSVLAAHQAVLGRQLAGPAQHRFVDVGWRTLLHGAVLLEGSAAWLEVGLHAEVDAGDHVIAVFEVLDLDSDLDMEPLVFHASRFRALS